MSVPHHHFEVEREYFMIALHDDDEPKSFQEAFPSSTMEQLMKSMEDEMEFMRTSHDLDLVDLPYRRKVVGNRWTLKIKHKTNGTNKKYKSCSMVKDHTQ